MEAYRGFAEVYDLFMDNVDYEGWCQQILAILEEEGIRNGLLLDLACGTGTMTELLAEQGYDMIGLDRSEEMLAIAMEKNMEVGGEILYLAQDMTDFELYGTVRAIVSVCDSLNYITEASDLEKVFSLVNNYLDPGGIFLFDVSTRFKYEYLLGDRTIAENREEASFIWENEFDPETGINTYAMTFFIDDQGDGRFSRYEETHFQRAYSPEHIRTLAERAGLVFVKVFDADTRGEIRETSERLCFVFREQGKK